MRNPAFLGTFALGKAKKFTFEVVTSAPDTVFTLPLTAVGGYTHNFTVSWGDSTSNVITAYDDVNKAHTYSSAGTYEVTIIGTCPGFKFNNSGSKLLITEVISWGNVSFRELDFYGCSNLTTLPEETGKLTLVTSFQSCFRGCSSLTIIPSGLFDNNTIVTLFLYCFRNCTSLTAIPSNLFDNNILVISFQSCFQGCTSLTAIPSNLFDNNILVISFQSCFQGCTSLTAIPSNLFDNNILVINVLSCFRNCTSLTAIPSNLFDNNILVYNFQNCFNKCNSLTSIPSGLFDNNTIVTYFEACFSNCSTLTGLAPTLWLREPEPTGTQCFYNATGLTNYGDIPVDWK